MYNNKSYEINKHLMAERGVEFKYNLFDNMVNIDYRNERFCTCCSECSNKFIKEFSSPLFTGGGMVGNLKDVLKIRILCKKCAKLNK